jgi:hypothetical protein
MHLIILDDHDMAVILCLVEQEEQVYKDESKVARDMESDRERERTRSSLDEISLGMAGTVIEGTDTSESGAEKPPMGCGDGLSGSSSSGHRLETQSTARQGRQGIKTRAPWPAQLLHGRIEECVIDTAWLNFLRECIMDIVWTQNLY